MQVNIPVVDLAGFLSGDKDLKNKFVHDLGKAYEEVGFVALKNHGINDGLIDDLYKYTKQFFGLPVQTKKNYEMPGLAGQRGYTSFGTEHAKGYDAPDLKEFFQFGQTVTDADPIKAQYPDNVSVAEIPSFAPTLLAAYKEHTRVYDDEAKLTNNRLKSTTHRVVNPPESLWATERYSMPFFLHPKSDMDLTSLDSCIDENHPKVYEDYTAGEYLDERLREIGLKK